MNELLACLIERNFQNKKAGIVKNGSWTSIGKIIKDKLSPLKNIEIVKLMVHIVSSRPSNNDDEIAGLVEAMSD